jgi:hypothetical protein
LIKELPRDAPSRCPFGHFELDYALLGDFQKPSLTELREALRRTVAHRHDWSQFWVPTLPVIEPQVIDDTIQCWLGVPVQEVARDTGHVDFWRASSEGRMFLLRGYSEGSDRWGEIAPGTIIDIRMPILQVAECLNHAGILGEFLAPNQDLKVHFRARWCGLAGRHLSSLDYHTRFWIRPIRTSRQGAVTVEKTIEVRQIADNLPEIILP